MWNWTPKGEELLDEFQAVNAEAVALQNDGLTGVYMRVEDVLDNYIFQIFHGFWNFADTLVWSIVALWFALQGLRFARGQMRGDGGEIAWNFIFPPLVLVVFQGWAWFDNYVYELFVNLPTYLGSVLLKSTGISPFGVSDPLTALDIYMEKCFVMIQIIESEVEGFLKWFYQFGFIVISVFQVVPLVGAIFLAKFGQTLLLGLTPMFITAWLLPPLKGVVEGWLRQLIGFSLLTIFVFAFMSMCLVVMAGQMSDLSEELVREGVKGGGMTAFIVIGSVFVYLAWQIQGMATSMAGGFALKAYTPGAGTVGAVAAATKLSQSPQGKAIKAMGLNIGKAIKQAFSK